MEKQTIMNNFKNTDLPFIGTKHHNFKNLTMNTHGGICLLFSSLTPCKLIPIWNNPDISKQDKGVPKWVTRSNIRIHCTGNSAENDKWRLIQIVLLLYLNLTQTMHLGNVSELSMEANNHM